VKQISAIGLDLAKNVFQVHGADAEGAPIFNRKLRRRHQALHQGAQQKFQAVRLDGVGGLDL
jgi:transposase